MRKNLKVTTAFQVAIFITALSYICDPLIVLDDDSSQLPEVMELFADITLPVKVNRLIKVG